SRNSTNCHRRKRNLPSFGVNVDWAFEHGFEYKYSPSLHLSSFFSTFIVSIGTHYLSSAYLYSHYPQNLNLTMSRVLAKGSLVLTDGKLSFRGEATEGHYPPVTFLGRYFP